MKKSKRNVLILTDHQNHSSENSLYALATAMVSHSITQKVDVVSRANVENKPFFDCVKGSAIHGTSITEDFKYAQEDHPLSKPTQLIRIRDYDLIWLRLPPPLSTRFLNSMDSIFKDAVIINNPSGIIKTGSKQFLLNFKNVCPPMKVCSSLSDIISFKNEFPIVLKPFREYGGRGIMKIDGDNVSVGNMLISFEEFTKQFEKNPTEYLAVKYLKNVGKGDKRIVVVNGEILGASLRLPAKGSWICNVAMGGTSNIADVDEEELTIVNTINPVLSRLGIVMYGLDTLVGDDGKRVLSEINTTSIGGLPQIAKLRKLPLVERAIELIWDYYEQISTK